MEINKDVLKTLGVDSLRESQKDVIDYLLNNNDDLIAVMPTGSGKTLCFQYYSIVSSALTIIVYPLIALMKDQMTRFKKSNISAVCLKGGQTKKERKDIFDRISNTDVKVVITNPEVLSQKSVLEELKKFKEIHLICDECHTIIEWGESFRSKMLELSNVISCLGISRICAFTATLSREVENGLSRYLFNGRNVHKIFFSSNRENIEYRHVITGCSSFALFNILKKVKLPAVIFINNRLGCEDTCQFVRRFFPKIPINFYHAKMSKEKREWVEKWFYSSDNGILVATCAFGMGVDKNNIRSVIHLRLPESVSAFLQESGRAGRDGKRSTSYVIIDRKELKYCSSPNRRELIKCFTDSNCTRENLLMCMGESVEKGFECTGCSKCYNSQCEDKVFDYVQDIVKKYRKSFSENELVLLLKGIKLKGVWFHNLIPFFSSLKHYNTGFISEMVSIAMEN